MKYEQLRDNIKNGDLVLVKGEGFGHTVVRISTGESFSHVGLFLWMEDGLWVADMNIYGNYRLTPASQYTKMYLRGSVFWGEAPELFKEKAESIRNVILSYRKQTYSVPSLLSVLTSQIVRRPMRNHGLVCSTFVEKIWESVGFKFDKNPDPGDYLELCRKVIDIDFYEVGGFAL